MSRAIISVAIVMWLVAAVPPEALAKHHGGGKHRGTDGTSGGPPGTSGGTGATQGTSGSDECLVEIRDQSGGLADGTTLCQTATQHICTFDLALCLNQAQPGCMPANFTGGAFHATGHCGPVRKLAVTPDGTSSVCGAFTGVDVRTRSSGKAPGRCTIRAEVRSAKVHARTDVDTVTLVCMPPGTACPGTTTTTSPSTTTTTSPSTTTTISPSTTTTTGAETTSTTVVSTTTTTQVSTTSVTGSTSTTTPVSSTTTTTGAAFTSLSFTTAPGTTSCGSAGFTTPPSAPASGALSSDTSCTTKISDLGLGCLYFGGGNATVVAGGRIPDDAESLLSISGPGTLSGSAGTGPADCTNGAGPGKHCINNNSLPACTGDGNCGGAAGSCGLDANCFFGPPLPILSPAPFGSLTTCVMNVVQTKASGTFDATTGASAVSLPLSSRVYISGNTASPCPKCLSGKCDPTWKTNTNTTSPDTGAACTPVGSQLTTLDCRPSLAGFQAPLPVNLTPLTSGTATETAPNGLFCPSQVDAGAFGKPTAECVQETGTPAGTLSDGAPHTAALASVFCIPGTGNPAVDGVADLPGPGAIGLNGVAQLK